MVSQASPSLAHAGFERHFKGHFALHSQTVQAIIQKFMANIATTRTNRMHGDRLILPMGRGREPLRVRVARLPGGKIAKIGIFHVGDVTEMNRGKRGKRSRRLNQELGNVPLGQLVEYLTYRLAAVGCTLQIGYEAHTSQTCPE
ncbi:MAG TPA: hypothetical protein VFE36_05435 [Candidatus Baltobacteraceae bacterium]|jgi:hypothetical protein|nr:hypothetical protein [Candidatus Baltobacteraceae bacterium]